MGSRGAFVVDRPLSARISTVAALVLAAVAAASKMTKTKNGDVSVLAPWMGRGTGGPPVGRGTLRLSISTLIEEVGTQRCLSGHALGAALLLVVRSTGQRNGVPLLTGKLPVPLGKPWKFDAQPGSVYPSGPFTTEE